MLGLALAQKVLNVDDQGLMCEYVGVVAVRRTGKGLIGRNERFVEGNDLLLR